MIKGQVRQMKDYNFFEIYVKKKGVSINPKSVTFAGFVLLLLLLLLSMGMLGRNFYLTQQISSLVSETDGMKMSKGYIEAQEIQTSVDAMKEYDENAEIALKKFRNINMLGTVTLSTISSAIPAGVSLNSMTIDHVITFFSFNVPDRKAAAELIANLKGLDIFLDVHLVSIVPKENEVLYSANIECVMKAGGEID